jgi:hypothetical protein
MKGTHWSKEHRLRLRRLIQQLYTTVEELQAEFSGEKRSFTLDGHLVGSIGEVVAAYLFNLTLLPSSFKGHDAVSSRKKYIQIKLTGGSRGVGLYSEPTHLIVLRLDRTGNRFEVVYNGPGTPALKACGEKQNNGHYPVSLNTLRQLNKYARPKLRHVRPSPTLI